MRLIDKIVVGICGVYLLVAVMLVALWYSSALTARAVGCAQAAVNAVGQATVDAINWTIVALW